MIIKTTIKSIKALRLSLHPFLWKGLGVGLLLFAACTSDSVEPGTEPQEGSYARVRMMNVLTEEPTRDVTGVVDYGDIRVFLTNGENVTEGLFKYTGEQAWTTQLKLKSGTRTYDMYGVMPADASVSYSLTSHNDNGAVLHISGLPALSARDYCVITGVKQTSSETDRSKATRGEFSFEYVSSRENYVNLLFDHLFSRVVFKMLIGSDYATLRTIKIKTMKLQVANFSKVNMDVTLKKGTGIESITPVAVSGASGAELTIMDKTDDPMVLTTTAAEACSGQFAALPALITDLVLVTTYDVYDKKGQKIAERTATNQLQTILAGLIAGEERTLTITVDPSYLYVLSDNDLDNPPFVIE